MSVFYLNGDFVEAGSASISATDLSVLRGYGVFDFLRTYGGVPFQLRAHLRRLRRSAGLIALNCPWDIEELAEIALETLRRNAFDESGIRLVITGGESPNGFMPTGESRLLVMVTPLQSPPETYYAEGAAVATVERDRYLPEAKTIHYIPGITAQLEAQSRLPAAVEAIYTVAGRVVEGTRSNIFVFKDGRWITPAEDLLPGITRAEVIKLLNGDLDQRAVSIDEFRAADEVILTSSTKEILPIVQVDDVTIGGDSPGENTRRLMARWRTMTGAYAAAGVVE